MGCCAWCVGPFSDGINIIRATNLMRRDWKLGKFLKKLRTRFVAFDTTIWPFDENEDITAVVVVPGIGFLKQPILPITHSCLSVAIFLEALTAGRA